MTKAEQPKAGPFRPPKLSRLGELAQPTKVVTAGQAFDNDLKVKADPMAQTVPGKPVALPKSPALPDAPRTAPIRLNPSIKRTFRYPKGLDSQLKRFVHKYNLEKREDEPELTMEEIGVLMAQHFLGSDPGKIARDARVR
jgi:hypothetical protein